MNCPRCGLNLEMREIQEFDNFALVQRSCLHCGVTWILKHQGNLIVSITQEELMGKEDYGFDYKCPHCGFESYVATSLQTHTGWKCLRCGKIVLNEYIRPRGDFKLAPTRVLIPGTRKRTLSQLSYQRTPRVSRPIPEGAISLATVAQELNIEPKRLRSWLRKVGWRSSEEARSQWIFSPHEAEEVKAHFRK